MENKKLKELEAKISHLKHTLEGIIPIWIQVDRRKKNLELEIKILEDRILDIAQGQLRIDLDF